MLKKINKKLETLSLKNKIFLSIILVIFLISVAIAFLARAILVSSLTEELKKRGFAIGHSIAERGSGYILDQNYPLLLALIFDEAKLKERRDLIDYIFVVDAKNKVISHTFVQPFPEELQKFIAQKKAERVNLLKIAGREVFDIKTPVKEGIYEIGSVHVGLNKAHVDSLIAKLRVTFLGFISLVIVFIFWLSHKLALSITRPVEVLTNVAKEVSKGNFEVDMEGDERVRKNCPAFRDHRFPCWHLDELGVSGGKVSTKRRCKTCIFYHQEAGDEVSQLAYAFSNMIWSIRLYRQKLKESELKYRSLFVSGPDPIFVLSWDDLRILDVNPRAGEVYNFEVKEMRGKSFLEFWPEARDFLSEDSPLFNEGYIYLSKIIHYTRDQKPFFVNVHACPISYEQQQAVILSCVDITDMIEKDAQIIQASKMKALGEMAAGMAHELNQPLNAIKMGADLLAYVHTHQHTELSEEEIVNVARELSVQVDRASDIINNLRQFSRKSTLLPERVDLNKVVEAVLTLLKQQFSLSDIEFKLDLNPKLPPILGYENRLQQVVFNLLNNARDAILERRKEEDFKGVIHIATYEERKRVVLFIADNGIGFREEDKHKLFEPFFTTKGKGKGMGLGLAIVKSIIKDHRGEILLEGGEKGAIFKIYLPLLEVVENGNKRKDFSH